MTAEVRVAVEAAEHLVVRGHDVDLPCGAHPELDAGAAERGPFDPLFDDATLVIERDEVLLDAQLLVLELDRAMQIGARDLEVEQRISETAYAPIELEDRAACARAPCSKLLDRVRQIVGAADIEADRMRNILLDEHAATSVFEPSQLSSGSLP